MAKLAAHGKELARVEIIYDLAGVKRRRQRVLMSDGAVLGQENTVGERRQGDASRSASGGGTREAAVRDAVADAGRESLPGRPRERVEGRSDRLPIGGRLAHQAPSPRRRPAR